MTVIITTLIADLLHPDTIYTRKLMLRGIRLQSGQDIDLLQGVLVSEVVQRDYPTVLPTIKLHEVYPIFDQHHHHGFPIVDEHGMLRGIVTLTDIELAHERKMPPDSTVIDMGTAQNLITAFPDDPIYLALRRMNFNNIGRLLVVDRDNPQRYVGIIRRSTILRAYDIGLTRKTVQQHKAEHFKLRSGDGKTLIDFTVQPDAPSAGQSLKEFPYSDNCLIVMIQRGGEHVVPHGDTVIKTGDQITAYVNQDALEKVAAHFASTSEPTPTP